MTGMKAQVGVSPSAAVSSGRTVCPRQRTRDRFCPGNGTRMRVEDRRASRPSESTSNQPVELPAPGGEAIIWVTPTKVTDAEQPRWSR